MGTAISSDAEVPRHSAIAPALPAELRLELATEGTWWYSNDASGPKHFRPGHCVEACCNRFQEQAFWWSAKPAAQSKRVGPPLALPDCRVCLTAEAVIG